MKPIELNQNELLIVKKALELRLTKKTKRVNTWSKIIIAGCDIPIDMAARLLAIEAQEMIKCSKLISKLEEHEKAI